MAEDDHLDGAAPDPDSKPPILWRLIVLGLFLVGSFLSMMSGPVTAGESDYHQFAEQRTVLGIPHFSDVVSNLGFLVVGVLGLIVCYRKPSVEAPISWVVFFAGVALVGVGSAYYHLAPEDATLVWGRLPMTTAFVGLSVAILAESIDPRIERFLLFPAVLAGASSVFYWYWFGDIRFYYWVQLLPIMIAPAALILFGTRYSHYPLLLAALAFYFVAKITESYDHELHHFTGGLASGHTIKHLAAGVACLSILGMQHWRRPRE